MPPAAADYKILQSRASGFMVGVSGSGVAHELRRQHWRDWSVEVVRTGVFRVSGFGLIIMG